MKTKGLAFQLVLALLAASLLAGCSGFARTTPKPLPTIVLDSGGTPNTQGSTSTQTAGGVTASGVVVPAQESQMAFSLGGSVQTVDVSIGDTVSTGQVLVRLSGQQKLEAAIAQAQLEVLDAQQAKQALEDNYVSQKAAALGAVADLNKSVRDARYQLDNYTVPAALKDQDPLDSVETMYKSLEDARLAFEPYKFQPQSSDTRQTLKRRLDEAQSNYDSAVRRLQLVIAFEEAQSRLQKAMDDLAALSEGPNPDDLAAADARISAAQAVLASTQSSLTDLELRAPFTGTVASLRSHTGEWVIPGQTVLALADLEHLRVETTDLSERDIPRVQTGQTVTVFIKALNQDVSGRLIEIAPLADTLGGDVVYKATIDLDELPTGLRSGMTVEVQF